MQCPYCSNKSSKVIDKRNSPDSIRRRRECLKCKKRYSTHERIEQLNIMVLKNNETRVHFDRNKIRNGISKACQKRLSDEELDVMVDKIEREIKRLKSMEVPSKKIGKIVMKYLKKTDQISYIRFTSVYQNFKNVEEFAEELKKLK